MKVKLDPGAFLPEQAHKDDAGFDLRSTIDAYVRKGEPILIDTGVHLSIPSGLCGIIKTKSGLNTKHGIVTEGDGVIDAGYTGPIKVKLRNVSKKDYYIHKGDKICQILFLPVISPEMELVDELDETERGEKGFGSTGR